MKSLKISLLLLVVLLSGNSYGQTKEETISWLQDNLEKKHVGI